SLGTNLGLPKKCDNGCTQHITKDQGCSIGTYSKCVASGMSQLQDFTIDGRFLKNGESHLLLQVAAGGLSNFSEKYYYNWELLNVRKPTFHHMNVGVTRNCLNFCEYIILAGRNGPKQALSVGESEIYRLGRII
ncbi:hypothetical protein ACJX0J_027773, partial [Zea mays]